MQKISGLSTKDGKPIYMNGHIEELRAVEEEKRKSKTPSRIFISQTGAQEHVQLTGREETVAVERQTPTTRL